MITKEVRSRSSDHVTNHGRPLVSWERRTSFLAVLSAFIAISLAAELTSYARPDIGFLLDAARRVMDGSKLYVDVVEINPPLIVALNIPAVLLARTLHVSDILIYRLGFSMLLAASLVLSARQLRQVLPEDLRRRQLLLLLAFALFPLSAQDFGQREHLLLAVTVPYLLLSAARALDRPVSGPEGFTIGALAGIGFALKPHFLALWIGLEAYLQLTRPQGRRLLPETCAISIVLAVYGVAILALTPQYFELLRLLALPYGRFLYDAFPHLLVTGPGAPLTLLALLAFVALRRRAEHPVLWNLLAIGVLACFLAGAAQQKGLRYHFYPSFALAVVLLGTIAADARAPLRSAVERIYRSIAVAATTAAVLMVMIQNVAHTLRLGPADERVRFEQLVHLVRAHGTGGRIYVMSYHIGSTYPLVNYSGVPSASRFPQLWILAAEYLDALKSPRPLTYHSPTEMSPSERYLNAAVLADIETHRPALLVVLRHARDLPVNGYRRLNYLAYFARDPRFASILKRYQRLADVGDYTIYERIPDGRGRTGPAPSSAPGTHDVIRKDREGLHLRLNDPTFVLSALVFLAVLVVALRREQ